MRIRTKTTANITRYYTPPTPHLEKHFQKLKKTVYKIFSAGSCAIWLGVFTHQFFWKSKPYYTTFHWKPLFTVLYYANKEELVFWSLDCSIPGFLGTPAGITTAAHPSSASLRSSGPWWLVTFHNKRNHQNYQFQILHWTHSVLQCY